MFLKRFFTFLILIVIGLLFIVVVGPEWPAFQDEEHKLNTIVGQRYYDFLVWEINALALKGEGILTAGHDFLDEEQRKELVLDYLVLLGEVRLQEAEINAIYADPEESGPEEIVRDLQSEVDQKRAQLLEWQPIVESIVQDQVATILVEEGFDVFGQAWPPVLMHITPLPYILVVSPREEIRQIHNLPLEHGLTAAAREDIELAIYEDLDRAALVVPIAGLGFFPAMILETNNINRLTEVTAHEWVHHWLTLHPVGFNYAASPALRTINETIASIVGNEIGERVIERYYPEFILPEEEPASNAAGADPDDPPPFDFNAEMAQTRIRVDELLAEGRVEEAEDYMEARRQFFWDNGYRLRKLNQAFFAFYGAYADTPGEQGKNPIGPALLAIRDNSSSLRDFTDRVASITSLDDLLEVAASTSSS
jgi:hypothetical protein